MLINRVSGNYDAYNAVKPVRKEARTEETQERDAVTTSARAKEFQAARLALSNVPDVRAEKVDRLKKQLEAGAYHVPAGAVADRIMEYGSGYFA